MHRMNKKPLPYKRYALRAAKELCYGDDIVQRIKDASTDSEIDRIMVSARARSCDRFEMIFGGNKNA